ncbi:hypothetical protein C8R47DRAFT_1146674 [Mycena vitilis]|nr:hypothetical protein C8R47DRAFT_1152807 [Mycena vitilis]KAJ6472142.1 hypothetical protein C8R47DRAFT_1146674 [Mycena vitilis]
MHVSVSNPSQRKDNRQLLEHLFPHLPPLDPFATGPSIPLPAEARPPSVTKDLRLPAIRTTVSPCALRNILNPVPDPDALPPAEPPYRRLEFLPVVPAKPTLSLASDEYQFITPSFRPEATAAERYHMYMGDYYVRPVKVQVNLRTMPWNVRFFAIESAPPIFITGHETFRTSGELQGRWTIDACLFCTEDDVLLRIKEHRKRHVTVLFIPRRYTKLPDPDPASQKYYQELVDEQYRRAAELPKLRASGKSAWDDPALPWVVSATTSTAPVDPAASTPQRGQIIQWVDTKDPTSFQ